jgi:gluconate 2-dehydrogenase gamma chain
MTVSMSVSSRRAFLLRTAALIPIVALGGRFAQAANQDDAPYVPTFFTPDEMAFVTAFVDRLIPSDAEGPGAVELGVPGFIDRQMNTPYGFGALWYMHGPFEPAAPTLGYQLGLPPRDLYRKGIPAADQAITQAFGKRFVDLDAATQDQAVTRMQTGGLKTVPVPAATLFGQILTNTKEGYFSDPIHGGNRGMGSWKMIGFPGARADFTDWVDRDDVKYPFGPVSITDLGA